jgi:ArsR family metal-binding transcriptional regulator
LAQRCIDEGGAQQLAVQEKAPLVFGYEIDKVLPCIADPARIRVIVRIDRDLSPLFPFMKGHLKRGIYLKDPPSFSYKREGKIITIYSDSVALTKLKDETEIAEEVARVSALVEFIEQNRDEIKPDHSSSRDLSPVALLKVLPRTNCKACGEQTCLAFVLQLLADERSIVECRPLFTEKYERERSVALNLLLESGFDLPMSAYL